MKNNKQIVRILSCLLLLTIFSFLPYSALADHNPLIYGRGGESDTLDPADTAISESIKVTTHIYDTLLVNNGGGSGEPTPGLALSWSSSEDQTRWTFKLRRDVTFHDGTPFNSEAVRFTFLRMIDPQHSFYKKGLAYAGFFSPIKEILTPDQDTVIFVLDHPYAPFLQNLCLPAAGIVSPTAIKRWGEEFGRHPVGTGPFVFKKWVDNDVIVLDQNYKYWGEGPFVDHLIFKTIPKDLDRLLALKAENIHIMDGFSFSAIDELNKNPQITLHEGPGLNVGYIAINTNKKHLDSVLVRRAINMAINKKRLVKLLCQGVAIPAVTPLPPGEWAFNSQLTDYPYDPEEARRLLKEAGWPADRTVTLHQSPVARSYMPYPVKFARFIKANLEAVGIRVKIVESSMKDFWTKVNTSDYDLIFSGWTADNGDPDNFFYSLFHSQHVSPPSVMNLSQYTNPELDKMLVQAQRVANREERKRLYDEIQAIILEQALWVPLAHGKVLRIARKNVQGVELTPVLPNIRLNKVRISTE